MTYAFAILTKMPRGDDRPPRWVTMISQAPCLDDAKRHARGTFGPGRVMVVRKIKNNR